MKRDIRHVKKDLDNESSFKLTLTTNIIKAPTHKKYTLQKT